MLLLVDLPSARFSEKSKVFPTPDCALAAAGARVSSSQISAAMGCSGSKARAAPMAETRPDPENEAAEKSEDAPSPVIEEVSAAIPEEHRSQRLPEVMEEAEDTQEESHFTQEPHVPEVLQQETDVMPQPVKSMDRDAHDDGETVTTAPKEDDSVVPGTEDKLEDAPDFPLCGFCGGWQTANTVV
mmetsp:Transcript_28202/g.58165  ORF Transcript_28202/g.58165 Transcript_28202/m.58165 type:complete len:185 (+) Transcript_28202:38-592(+)